MSNIILNEDLLKQNKVTKTQKQNLYKIYEELNKALEQSKEDYNNLTEQKAKEYVDKVRELEFKLQDNWSFPKDANYHTYWDKLYGCKCPKMDNSERFGYPKIINMSCKYHKYIKK